MEEWSLDLIFLNLGQAVRFSGRGGAVIFQQLKLDFFFRQSESFYFFETIQLIWGPLRMLNFSFIKQV